MRYFARCPECGAVNDGSSSHCYLCGKAPLLVACRGCGMEVRNPIHTNCPSCRTPYGEARLVAGSETCHESAATRRKGNGRL